MTANISAFHSWSAGPVRNLPPRGRRCRSLGVVAAAADRCRHSAVRSSETPALRHRFASAPPGRATDLPGCILDRGVAAGKKCGIVTETLVPEKTEKPARRSSPDPATAPHFFTQHISSGTVTRFRGYSSSRRGPPLPCVVTLRKADHTAQTSTSQIRTNHRTLKWVTDGENLHPFSSQVPVRVRCGPSLPAQEPGRGGVGSPLAARCATSGA